MIPVDALNGSQKNRRRLAVWVACLAAMPCLASAQTAEPPKAERHAHQVTTAFGASRDDEYFWLRDDTRKDPKVIGYLNAENRYTDQFFSSIATLRERVRTEISSRIPAQE